MIKGVTHAHLGPIWYHSEPSDVPYSPNQFSWLGLFFAVFYRKMALSIVQSSNISKLYCCWFKYLQKDKIYFKLLETGAPGS